MFVRARPSGVRKPALGRLLCCFSPFLCLNKRQGTKLKAGHQREIEYRTKLFPP